MATFGEINNSQPFGFGVSSQGNTLGTTGTVNGQLILVGGNNITLSQSTNATGATVTISNPPGGGAGDGWNLIAAGTQTANSTGTILFNNSNGITFGMSNSSIVTASHNGLTTQTVQTQNMVSIFGSTGDVSFSNSNNVTFGGNNSTITASASFNQTVQTQGMVSVNGSTGNISLATGSSLSSSSNGSTITFGLASNITTALQSAGAYLTTAMQSASSSVFAKTGFTTASTAGTDIVGTHDTNGLSMGIPKYLTTAQPVGAYLTTAAQSDHSHGNPTLALTNLTGTTASASNGLTLSLSAANPGGGATANFYTPFNGSYALAQMGQNTVRIQQMLVPTNMVIDRINIYPLLSQATNSTGTVSVTHRVGLYTNNGGTLSLATSSSVSAALTYSGNNANSSTFAGIRVQSIPFPATITAGNYWYAHVSSTTTGGNNASFSQLMVSQINSVFSGSFGQVLNASMQLMLGDGIYSVTSSSLPTAIQFNEIRHAGTAFNRSQHYINLANGTA